MRAPNGLITQVSTGLGASTNPVLSPKKHLLAFQSTSHPQTGLDTGVSQIWLGGIDRDAAGGADHERARQQHESVVLRRRRRHRVREPRGSRRRPERHGRAADLHLPRQEPDVRADHERADRLHRARGRARQARLARRLRLQRHRVRLLASRRPVEPARHLRGQQHDAPHPGARARISSSSRQRETCSRAAARRRATRSTRSTRSSARSRRSTRATSPSGSRSAASPRRSSPATAPRLNEP